MSSQTVTIISGIALFVVFGLVGWNLRRNRRRGEKVSEKESGHAQQ